ncbi:acetylcholine receptor subunit alpha-like 2 [Tubulanus polymorphus]|uniref:acetylcholine receptor subunit alpha-like 2 n=1 Tax=Tubulanus polymorphus TaxID=672921 RepID=UPI003DA27FD6
MLLAVSLLQVDGQDVSQYQRLFQDLFSNYDRRILPRKDQKTVQIQFGAALIKINELSERQQMLHVNLWLRMHWNDFRLVWTPADYGNTSVFRVPADNIWYPDLVLYNDASGGFAIPSVNGNAHALVYSDGSVLWIPPKQFQVMCEIETSRFPHDRHTCSMKFGSWTYSGDLLNMTYYEGREDLDLSDYSANDDWEIVASTGRRFDKFYPCCVEPYPDITYNLTLKRTNPDFYVTSIFLPSVILTFIVPFLFLIRPDRYEKSILGIGATLGLLFLLKISLDIFPSAMKKTPVILMFQAGGLFLAGIGLLITHIHGNLWISNFKNSPPNCLTSLCVQCFGRITCVGADDDGEPLNGEQKSAAASEWRLLIAACNRFLFIVFIVLITVLAFILLTP